MLGVGRMDDGECPQSPVRTHHEPHLTYVYALCAVSVFCLIRSAILPLRLSLSQDALPLFRAWSVLDKSQEPCVPAMFFEYGTFSSSVGAFVMYLLQHVFSLLSSHETVTFSIGSPGIIYY